MKVLVTGGAGYIGSHTCLQLLRSGCEVHVVDNLFNGSVEAIHRIKLLANQEISFTECDIRNADKLFQVFDNFGPDCVVHFAGLKSVSESLSIPAEYYSVNVGGTAAVLSAMERVNCERIVFSSSATVYGNPVYLPCDEKHQVNPINPYGRSKLMAEDLLRDWSQVLDSRRVVSLRYFNPVGADPSGLIGEMPKGEPNNLMPFISQVAAGLRSYLQVFGSDYETIDGTGVRDYVHVVDLAHSHVAALKAMPKLDQFEVFNIGTGRGISVLEMLREFEKVSGRRIDYRIAPRRYGDSPAVWADSSRAAKMLNFSPNHGITEMCSDTWRWQCSNPNGYGVQEI